MSITIECPKCEMINRNENNFCHSCGAELKDEQAKRCACGTVLETYFIYCTFCGEEVNCEKTNNG